jgi:hypothetical protein
MSYEFGRSSEVPAEPIRDKDAEIPSPWLWPHYSGPFFDAGAVSVYLDPTCTTTRAYGSDEVDGADYQYGDRLNVDYEKYHAALERAEQELGTKSTARYFETAFRYAMEDPALELVHLITGVNRSNGNPYHVYGFRHGQQEPVTTDITGSDSLAA